jgi:hypothetical protein
MNYPWVVVYHGVQRGDRCSESTALNLGYIFVRCRFERGPERGSSVLYLSVPRRSLGHFLQVGLDS